MFFRAAHGDVSLAVMAESLRAVLHPTLLESAAALPWATRRNVLAVTDELAPVVAGLMPLDALLTCPDPRIREAAILSLQTTDVPAGTIADCSSAPVSGRP